MNTENKQRAGRRSARLGAAAAAAATNNKAAMSDKPVSPVLSTRTSAKRKRGTTDDEQKMEMDDKSVPVTPLESPVLEGEPVGGNQEALLRSTATLSISDDLDMENGNSKRRKIIPLAIDNSDPFDGVSAQQRHRGFVPVSPVDGDEKYPYSSLPHTHLQQRPMLGERRVSTLSSLLLPQENESKAGQGRMYTDRSRDDQRLSTANTSQTERYRPTLTPPPPAASSYPILPSFQTLLDVASPKKQSYRPRREDDHRTHREWNSGRHESRHQPLPHPHRHHDGNPQPQTQHSHASHRPHSQYSHPSHHPQHPNHSHYPQYHGYSQQQQHHYQHPHHPHHHHHEHSNLTSFPPSRDHQTSAKQAKRRQTISYQYSSSASDDAILTSFAPPARHPHVGGGRTVAPIRKQPWAHGSRSSELRFESVENMRWRGSGGGGIGDHGHGHGHGHGRTKSTASSTSSQRMMIDTHV
ncbi:hypothetical protein FRC17_003160 [Serendipita sp. 399]|nr:hypothetical protein FRC17_003160 [Serendipita sp. 399]